MLEQRTQCMTTTNSGQLTTSVAASIRACLCAWPKWQHLTLIHVHNQPDASPAMLGEEKFIQINCEVASF